MKYPRAFIAAALVALLCVMPGFAGEGNDAGGGGSAEVGPAESDDIDGSLSLNLVATSRLEAAAGLTETITVPFMTGDGPLTRGNNVKFKLGVEVSPATVNGSLETVWTPAAFLELIAGASAGTGWNTPIADGLRMNTPGRDESGGLDGSAEYTGDSFSGMVWSAKGGAALQFDLAAVLPGEWNHVAFRTYHGLLYRALTSADGDESWLFKTNEGEERNGWNYYANYLIAWRMPARFDMVALLLEQELRLYDERGGDAWGEDLFRFTVGATGQYRIAERISAMLALQFRTRRNFEGSSGDNDFYQCRIIDGDDPRRIEFYRALISVAWKLD